MKKKLEKEQKKFICEMDYKNNILLYEKINKNLLIKVLKRTKNKAALKSKNDNEIIIKFAVYK